MKRLLFVTLLLYQCHSLASELVVEISIPAINANPYHRPYVAVWLESENRQGIHTLAFWREQEDWYKDLRQWWRKIGRKGLPNFDAVSGATRKPGVYRLTFDGQLSNGMQLNDGRYVLHIEAVREQGGREYLKQPLIWSANEQASYELKGQRELGLIRIVQN